MDPASGGGASGGTISAVISRALDAYRRLGDLGEEVADEWQYVNDLVAVHSADLQTLVDADPQRHVDAFAARAVDAAINEIGQISDPHRAIDWLSTFPQIVRAAVAPPSAAA